MLLYSVLLLLLHCYCSVLLSVVPFYSRSIVVQDDCLQERFRRKRMANNEDEGHPLVSVSNSSSAALLAQTPTPIPQPASGAPPTNYPAGYGALGHQKADDACRRRTLLEEEGNGYNGAAVLGNEIYDGEDGQGGLPSEEEETAIVDAMEKDPAASFQNPRECFVVWLRFYAC